MQNKEFPIVSLLSADNEPLKKMWIAARTCYSNLSPIELEENFSTYESQADRVDKLLKREELVYKVLDSGHTTIAEHINFTFSIEGISRACSHQLVRFRHASYSQQSQRYVTEKNQFEYITPESISKLGLCNIETSHGYYNYELIMQLLHEMYEGYVEKGILPEDARFVLPNAACTNIVITMNLRELIHMFELRLCAHSQLEIRELFRKIRNILLENEDYKFLKKYFVPNCKKCTDFRPCPNKKRKINYV